MLDFAVDLPTNGLLRLPCYAAEAGLSRLNSWADNTGTRFGGTMRLRAIALYVFAFAVAGCQSGNASLESKCQELGKDRIEKLKRDTPDDFLILKTSSFYSKVLGTCVFTEVPEEGTSGVEYNILDLSHSFLRDTSTILHCDKSGADSVVVDRVRKFGGYTYSVMYSEWLDDGFGGAPRTLKTPERPYTSKDCERVFRKWMDFLK